MCYMCTLCTHIVLKLWYFWNELVVFSSHTPLQFPVLVVVQPVHSGYRHDLVVKHHVIDISVQRRFLVSWRNVPTVVAVGRHLEIWRHRPIFDLDKMIRINGSEKKENKRVKNKDSKALVKLENNDKKK